MIIYYKIKKIIYYKKMCPKCVFCCKKIFENNCIQYLSELTGKMCYVHTKCYNMMKSSN